MSARAEVISLSNALPCTGFMAAPGRAGIRLRTNIGVVSASSDAYDADFRHHREERMQEPRNEAGGEGVAELPPRSEIASVLVENRRAFLSFLERRVGHRDVAEDVLQEAFARSLDKLPFESEESAVAWFYRVLRNAVVDHYRRGGANERALSVLARQLDEQTEPDLDERNAVCHCVARLSETLKSEYALALRRIDVEGVSVQDYAVEAGIT